MKGSDKMCMIEEENVLELIKMPGNMVKITGLGVVSLFNLYHEGEFLRNMNNELVFISTDELIGPYTKKVTGCIAKQNRDTGRMSPEQKVTWAVKWLY